MGPLLLFVVLYAAWVIAVVLETRDLGDRHAGVSADAPKVPHLWHAEFETLQPLLRPPPPAPLPRYINNSAAMAAMWWQEEERRNALATIEVSRMAVRRNSALLAILSGARWAPNHRGDR